MALGTDGITLTKTGSDVWVQSNGYSELQTETFYNDVTFNLGNYVIIGVCIINYYQDFHFGNFSSACGLDVANGKYWINGISYAYTSPPPPGTVIRTQYTKETGDVEFFYDGISQGVISVIAPGTNMYFASAVFSKDGNGVDTVTPELMT